jgi:hypothetical protein
MVMGSSLASLRARRSNPVRLLGKLDCFVAVASRNDEDARPLLATHEPAR